MKRLRKKRPKKTTRRLKKRMKKKTKKKKPRQFNLEEKGYDASKNHIKVKKVTLV